MQLVFCVNNQSEMQLDFDVGTLSTDPLEQIGSETGEMQVGQVFIMFLKDSLVKFRSTMEY